MGSNLTITALVIIGFAVGSIVGLKQGYKRGDIAGSRRGFVRGLAVSRNIVDRISNGA